MAAILLACNARLASKRLPFQTAARGALCVGQLFRAGRTRSHAQCATIAIGAGVALSVKSTISTSEQQVCVELTLIVLKY